MPKQPRDHLSPRPKPKVEEKPMNEITMSAFAYCMTAHQQRIEALAQQTLAAMGLKPEDGWKVFIEEGVVRRTV